MLIAINWWSLPGIRQIADAFFYAYARVTSYNSDKLSGEYTSIYASYLYLIAILTFPQISRSNESGDLEN